MEKHSHSMPFGDALAILLSFLMMLCLIFSIEHGLSGRIDRLEKLAGAPQSQGSKP